MKVTLTNDDGYDAPGLRALWEAVRRLPDVHVQVVAPAGPQSGVGHTHSDHIDYRRETLDPMGPIIVVEGTPADCTLVALHAPDVVTPDWVLSGINRGGNLGVDQYNSGTVAAAREAAIQSVPGIALSQVVHSGIPLDWDRTSREAAAVLAALLQPNPTAPPDIDVALHRTVAQAVAAAKPFVNTTPCWNVNFPARPEGQPTTRVSLTPLSGDPVRVCYDHEPADGAGTLRYVGRYPDRAAAAGSDVEAALNDTIAISQIIY